LAANSFVHTTVETKHITAGIETDLTTDFSGGARINTPILDVEYPTHRGPFGLEGTLENISLNQLIESLTSPTDAKTSTTSLSQTLQQEGLEISQGAQEHAIKYLLVGGAVAGGSFMTLSLLGKSLTNRNVDERLLVVFWLVV
jgi:hypothetical protein